MSTHSSEQEAAPGSQQKLHIRRACPDDLQTLVHFNQAMAFETEAKKLPDNILTSGVKTVLADNSLGQYFIAVAAQSPAEILGALMLTFEWSDWRNGRFWWIQSVYVASQHRRRGIYSRLHEHVKALSRKDRTCCGIRLYVERENTIAQRTYAHLGMQETHYYIFEEEYPNRSGERCEQTSE